MIGTYFGSSAQRAVAAVQGGSDQRTAADGQGANDPRVNKSESDQIVGHAQERQACQYYVFPDEGHGFARPANNMAFNAASEEFLAKWFEPATTDESKLLASIKQ